ncbi:essential MCU regulator, mitochondrial isoform X1 [Pongo abelii]|uniref:essential MCU regulator, mitochondrial isoform X1 n=1 Tax=Pongo abelii TaxID=9601 RepID=UPI0023E839AF|nr:uncharacterized protein LOC100458161 isoform X1 [Pongo abelii]XP_054399526.1 uncharacterized protein LOC100458161 isoform X1 [Pongo abelii]
MGQSGKDCSSLIAVCHPSHLLVWRHKVKSRKKPTSEVTTPRRPGELNAAAPKEEAAVLSQEGEQVKSPGEEAPSPIPAEQEVAGTPDWEENKKVQKEVAAYPSEASEDSKEQRPWERVSVPMTELWLDWFSASNTPNTQNREEKLSNKSKSCCCHRPGCRLSGPPSSEKPSLASSTLPVPTAAGTALPATEPCDHSGLSPEGPKGALATLLTRCQGTDQRPSRADSRAAPWREGIYRNAGGTAAREAVGSSGKRGLRWLLRASVVLYPRLFPKKVCPGLRSQPPGDLEN